MEFEQLQTFAFVLMSICGGVVGIAAAVAIVVKFWKWAHAGSDKNSEEIKELKTAYDEAKTEYMAWFASDKRRIQGLEERQDEAERINKLQLKAMFTLLSHEIDGNHTEQLAAVRDEINTYLIEK